MVFNVILLANLKDVTNLRGAIFSVTGDAEPTSDDDLSRNACFMW